MPSSANRDFFGRTKQMARKGYRSKAYRAGGDEMPVGDIDVRKHSSIESEDGTQSVLPALLDKLSEFKNLSVRSKLRSAFKDGNELFTFVYNWLWKELRMQDVDFLTMKTFETMTRQPDDEGDDEVYDNMKQEVDKYKEKLSSFILELRRAADHITKNHTEMDPFHRNSHTDAGVQERAFKGDHKGHLLISKGIDTHDDTYLNTQVQEIRGKFLEKMRGVTPARPSGSNGGGQHLKQQAKSLKVPLTAKKPASMGGGRRSKTASELQRDIKKKVESKEKAKAKTAKSSKSPKAAPKKTK